MALEDTGTIDIVVQALTGQGHALELMIVEGQHATDEMRRYRLLVDKLGGYVAYVASDEFAREHPGLSCDDVLIRVLCLTPPNEAMTQVSAVRPPGNDRCRVPVRFDLYHEFMRAFRAQGELQA
jgi:hypothetical protein